MMWRGILWAIVCHRLSEEGFDDRAADAVAAKRRDDIHPLQFSGLFVQPPHRIGRRQCAAAMSRLFI